MNWLEFDMIATEIQFLTAAVWHVFLVQKWTSLKLALTENEEPQSQTDFRFETSRSCSSLWDRFEANLFFDPNEKNPWCPPLVYFSKVKVSLICHQVIRASPYTEVYINGAESLAEQMAIHACLTPQLAKFQFWDNYSYWLSNSCYWSVKNVTLWETTNWSKYSVVFLVPIHSFHTKMLTFIEPPLNVY